jgi:tape measure domain-containing protein
MSRFLETAQYLKELNTLWDQHAQHVQKANTNLNTLLRTVNKLPSAYISNMKKMAEAQDLLTSSTNRLNSVTLKQIQELTSLQSKRSAFLASNKALAKAVQELEAKLKKVDNELEILKNKSNAASDAQSRTRQRISETEKQVDSLNRKLSNSNTAISLYSNGMNGLRNLMSAFGVSMGLYLAADITKNIYNTTKELQSLDLALKMVSGDAKTFHENKLFIQDVAQRWGIEVKELTERYTQFYTAAKGILSTEKIKTVFESIAKSGAVMGLSLEKQNSAFYAFEQMMSKGVVASEELKKQLGNAMPGAMKAAGMAYMELHPKIKTIQEAEKELMEGMKAGAIDSATYVPLIVKNFEKLYGIEMVEKVQTLQAAQERLANSWTEVVRAMSVADQNTVAGRILVGMTILANGLLVVLKDIVSTQAQINDSFRDEGERKGTKSFAEDLLDYGGKTDKEKVRFAHKQMAEDYQEAVYVQNKIAELNKKLASSWIPQSFRWGLKAEIEAAYRSLGYFNARVEAAKKIIHPEIIAKADAPGESDKERKAREKRERESAKLAENENKLEYEAGLSSLKNEKFILEQKMLLKDNNYSENIRLATQIGIKEFEIAKYMYDEELRLAKDNKNKKLIADNKYYQEKEKLAKSTVERIDKVEYNSKNKYKDSGKVADYETYGGGVFETDASRYKDMVDLWKQQQDEKDRIAKKEKERLQAMRDVLNDIFKQFGTATGFEKTMDIFTKVGKNGKTFWENLTGGKDGKIELEEYMLAGLTIVQDVGNKIFQENSEKYERRRAQLEKQKEEAIKNAGESATAKAAIEEEYEKKSKEIDKREAVAKKKQAMFNIAMDTAQAIMGLWVKPGFPAAIPLAIAVGALGAVQLAIASSKPIPSYWTGTDNASEGFANVDELGAEIHTDKHGRIKDFGSNKGPRVKYLNEGDKIIPAHKSANILKALNFTSLDDILSLNNISYSDDKNIQLDTSEIVSGLNKINSTIENKESSEEHYDLRGWSKFSRINGQKIESKNNRVRFKKSIL